VFPLSYDSSQGTTIQGAASPAQGAMYAPLALKAPILAINANPIGPNNPSGTSPSHIGVIAAGIVGAVAIIVIGIVIFVPRARSFVLGVVRQAWDSAIAFVRRFRARSSYKPPSPSPSPPSPPREELSPLLLTAQVDSRPLNQTPFGTHLGLDFGEADSTEGEPRHV